MTLQTNTTGFGKLLEPGLRKIFFETYPEKSEQFNQIFNVTSSKKAKEYDLSLGGFAPWTDKAEGGEVTFQDPVSGYEITYSHKAFSSAFRVTREMHDDEQYNIINKLPKNLARAGRTKVETDAASVLNSGFDGVARPIYDGQALFSTAHPLKGGGTASNLATGALTDANLKLAIKQMHDIPDEVGNKIQYTPNKLIVPRNLEFVAKEIVQSNQKAGTANNDINTVKGALEVVVYDYLTDQDAWFIMDSSIAQLNYFWRVKPEFKHEEDFKTMDAMYRGYMRYSFGCSDFRGIVGSVGA